jgi:predicted nuclease of restriction endonuclease-like (RecB) superfamily
MTVSRRTDEGPRRLPQGTTAAQAGLPGLEPMPPGYLRFLEDLKGRIRTARVKASLSANRELIELYWHIGKGIVERQRAAGWGISVVERLSSDLRSEFPGNAGFSAVNIWRMRAFYLAYAAGTPRERRDDRKTPHPILSQAAQELSRDLPETLAAIPWFHNVVLVEKLKERDQRLWYAQKTVEHGWSRAVLVHQMETGLYRRSGRAVTNFAKTLPPIQSDLAAQVMKDPYVFDIKAVNERLKERELERCLVDDIRKLLLELGVGFAFVGSQYHIEVEGEDFYIDMLFYHLRLRCFVVIDLKTGPFRPEHAGKMNFYLSAVDDMLKNEHDNPTIGIILCKTKKKLIAEYALRNMEAPIGVSGYRFTREMPVELRSSMPSAEDLERRLKGRD